MRGQFRPGDVRHLVHDASRIRALGWEPAYTLEGGIAAFVEWIQSLGAIEDYFTQAFEHLRRVGVVAETRRDA